MYTKAHLERLQAIQKLQAGGLMLAEIARRLSGDGGETALPPPSAWWSYAVVPDVIVWVRSGLSPWRVQATLPALPALLAAGAHRTQRNLPDP